MSSPRRRDSFVDYFAAAMYGIAGTLFSLTLGLCLLLPPYGLSVDEEIDEGDLFMTCELVIVPTACFVGGTVAGYAVPHCGS